MSDGGAEQQAQGEQGQVDDGGAEAATELEQVKARLGEFRDNNIKLMKQLDAFKGIDPTEYRSMAAKLQELEHQQKADKAGITSDQLQKLRQEIRGDLEKEYKQALDELEGLRTDNRSLRLDSVVKAEMAKAGVRSERIDALFRLNADKFDLTDDGVPILRERPGAEIGKYVADELRQEYPEFYNGSGSSGGGASKSSAPGGAGYTRQIAASDKDTLSANLERIASGEAEVVM